VRRRAPPLTHPLLLLISLTWAAPLAHLFLSWSILS
jgi:hypothetical protein